MIFPFRTALADFDDVASEWLFDGGGVPEAPLVTIAVPTFNRPELLKEAIASALSQDFDQPMEVLIVDNRSDEANVRQVLDDLRSLGTTAIRYCRNDANIGMFGNWNRCLTLARGRWVTILNDDDLLRPNHLHDMFGHIERGQTDASYIPNFSFLDQRAHRTRSRAVDDVLLRVKRFLRFYGRREIALTPKRLFWANIAGSSVGCVVPRALAIEIGGFYPEDFPSADYLFHVRASLKHRLRQVPDVLGVIRLQVNESMKPETCKGFILRNHSMRIALIENGSVPRWWRRVCPVLVGYEIRATERIWGVRLDAAAVAAEAGVALRYWPSGLVWLIKAVKGGV